MLGSEGNTCKNTCSVFIKMQAIIFQPTIAGSLLDKKTRMEHSNIKFEAHSKEGRRPMHEIIQCIKSQYNHMHHEIMLKHGQVDQNAGNSVSSHYRKVTSRKSHVGNIQLETDSEGDAYACNMNPRRIW